MFAWETYVNETQANRCEACAEPFRQGDIRRVLTDAELVDGAWKEGVPSEYHHSCLRVQVSPRAPRDS